MGVDSLNGSDRIEMLYQDDTFSSIIMILITYTIMVGL